MLLIRLYILLSFVWLYFGYISGNVFIIVHCKFFDYCLQIISVRCLLVLDIW